MLMTFGSSLSSICDLHALCDRLLAWNVTADAGRGSVGAFGSYNNSVYFS